MSKRLKPGIYFCPETLRMVQISKRADDKTCSSMWVKFYSDSLFSYGYKISWIRKNFKYLGEL